MYLLTASGLEQSDVGLLRIEVVKSIVERLDLAVTPGTGIIGKDGRDYAWFGPGSVILAIPLYSFGKLTGIAPASMITVLYPLLGSGAVVLLYLFAVSLGYSRHTSLVVASLYGFGTMAWYYAKNTGDHGAETFFILLAVYSAYRYVIKRKLFYLYITGCALGFALIIRPTSILVLPPLFLLLYFYNPKKEDLKPNVRADLKYFAIIVAIVLPFVCIYCCYNYLRFGSIFETGYGLIASRLGVDNFDTPIQTGLLGLLASPGKGFFIYSPVTVLFFFSVKPFFKKHNMLAISFVLLIVLYILFYAKYRYWHGCNGWGPRFIFVITPFVMIPIAELIESASLQKQKLVKFIFYTVCVISFMIQFISVSVNGNQWFVRSQLQQGVKYKVESAVGVQPIVFPPTEIFFDWGESPVIQQIISFAETLKNMKSYIYVIPTEGTPVSDFVLKEPWMNTYDFWWLYLYVKSGSCNGFLIAGLLVIYSIYCATKLLCLHKAGLEQ